MNRLVVMRATWGLGTHLLAGVDEGARTRGCEASWWASTAALTSRRFAEDVAAVLAGLGIPVQLFPDPVPTPLVSFAVPQLGAAMGVVVTASHNPPEDNGYKVYLETGAQIAPPVDPSIAAHIAAAPPLGDIARPAPADAAAAGMRRLVDARTREIEDAYLDGLDRAALHPPEPTPLRIAYTAMHGVGHRVVIRALTRAGFEGVASEPSQCDPDGTFPTVRFPNPEEPGAMSRVLALAEETGAELVLANDPDADRLAAAIPDPAGGYRMLSGNEIGVLLAADAIEHADTGGRRKVVVTTVVSSSLLARIAGAKDVAYRETLTGFKWIIKAALEAEEAGEAFVFGYEEALGYTVGPLVRDKDGIGAAVHLARLARFLKSRGRTLADRIDELLMAHELVHPVQWSVVLARPRGPGADPRRHGDPADPAPRAPRAQPGGAGGRRRRRKGDGERDPPAHRPAPGQSHDLPVRRRGPPDRPAERHRAQDQVLPRARRPGAHSGGGRRGPLPSRGGGPGAAGGAHPGAEARVSDSPHRIEPASSARAKCRGCGERIAASELRFGESLPNPFADGEMTLWFHLDCAAFKRPEPFLETLEGRSEPIPDHERLAAAARVGLAHRRLPRVDGAGRAPTGRAQCRSCRAPIEKGAWRIALVFYEEGRFAPSGFVHARCGALYFETTDILPRVHRFSPALREEDLAELQEELARPAP